MRLPVVEPTVGRVGRPAPSRPGGGSPRPAETDARRDDDAAASERREHPELWAALGEVLDPELPVSIVELGLVYDIRRERGRVDLDLTFTAIGCPCMDLIRDDVTERLLAEEGVDDVVIHEVWDPPWTRARISESGRLALRRVGVAS